MATILYRQPFTLLIKNNSNQEKKVVIFDPLFKDDDVQIIFTSGGKKYTYKDFLELLSKTELFIGRSVIRSIEGRKRVYSNIHLDTFSIYQTVYSKKIKFKKMDVDVPIFKNTKQNLDLFIASFNTRLTFNNFPINSTIELLLFPLAVPKNNYN